MSRKIKYTTESYAREVNRLSGGNFTVLGHYVRGNIKILVRHNVCGSEYEIVASALLGHLRRGHEPCKHCAIENTKITREQFIERISEIFGDEYVLVGEYNGYTQHTQIKHVSCGRTWDIIPKLFVLKKKGCPFCAKRGHVDLEEAKERVNDVCGEDYELIKYSMSTKPLHIQNKKTGENIEFKNLHTLEKYGPSYKPRTVNKKKDVVDYNFRKECEDNNCKFDFEWISPKKAHLICKECGHSFNRQFSKKTKPLSCPVCTPVLKKGTQEYVEHQLKELGDRYEMLSEYISTTSLAVFRHKKCGTVFNAPPGRLLHELKYHPEKDPCCPNCQGKKGVKKTTQEYQAELDAKTNKSFHLLSEYVDGRTPVKVRHRCGHEYFVTPEVLNTKDSYSACPACSSSTNSSGSQKIEHYFISHNIEYSKEYSFPDLRDKTRLRFDFAVMNNGHLAFLVEFDGPQHFKPVSIFGGEDYLSTLQLHDNMKDKYCRANNIALKRISYEQEGLIEQILSDAIKEFVI